MTYKVLNNNQINVPQKTADPFDHFKWAAFLISVVGLVTEVIAKL